MSIFNGLKLGTALLGAGLLATIVSAHAEEPAKVAAIVKGLDNPFFQTMQKGIEEQGKANGVNVSVQAAANMGDATGQADRLTAMAMQDFDCYLVNPISVSNLVQALVPVAQKKKPISTSTRPSTPNRPRPPALPSPPISAPTTSPPVRWPARKC